MNEAFLAALLSLTTTPAFVSADPLPGTQPLTDNRDLARVMVNGIHVYLDQKLKDSSKKRDELWKADAVTKEAFAKSLPEKRERLKQILGVVDQRVPPKLEFISGPNQPSLLAEFDGCKIHAVRWAVLNGIDAEGLLIEPKEKPKANVVVISHSDRLPEIVAGLRNEPYPKMTKRDPNNQEQFLRETHAAFAWLERNEDLGLSLAQNGCRVLIPSLIDRNDEWSSHTGLKKRTNIPHREFIHRMAYEMGRTLNGFEVQKVLAAIDWFKTSGGRDASDSLPVGVLGYGDGGMIATYAGALDDRIAVTQVSGYFNGREISALQPLDRNQWNILGEFSDLHLGLMIHPRKFIPDARRQYPKWNGPNSTDKQKQNLAAPGVLDENRGGLFEELRYRAIFNQSVKNQLDPETNPIGVIRMNAAMFPQTFLDQFVREICRVEFVSPKTNFQTYAHRGVKERHKRQFDQLIAYCQSLWRNSEPVRKEFWKKSDSSSPEAWEKSCDWYREYFHDEIIGRLPKPTMPLNPKSRPIYDTPKWTGHEVTLDVYPDVMAYGILLLPKDLKPGEKRPVVVCQHGLEGRPTDVCNPKEKTKYYHSFGAQLADKGYIVFAPQNPYIFDDHFRQILRKANPLKLSLFSFIIRQHERILDWLETQPHVDPKRIAFYGLSYGGKTAMRVPAVEKRYCLSICSGDFNEWIGKIVSTELPMSYMYTKEYDMLEFNLGHTFNYAEMAYMIAPRPFMVERGHDDGVGIDEMVAYEYAKVRYLYANKLKIPDRTEIEFFPGGHQINGKGTFEFLQRHLQYPR